MWLARPLEPAIPCLTELRTQPRHAVNTFSSMARSWQLLDLTSAIPSLTRSAETNKPAVTPERDGWSVANTSSVLHNHLGPTFISTSPSSRYCNAPADQLRHEAAAADSAMHSGQANVVLAKQSGSSCATSTRGIYCP